jgi:hypothetical protein
MVQWLSIEHCEFSERAPCDESAAERASAAVVLHATPDAPQINADDAVPFLAGAIGGRGDAGHHARIVESGVEASELALSMALDLHSSIRRSMLRDFLRDDSPSSYLGGNDPGLLRKEPGESDLGGRCPLSFSECVEQVQEGVILSPILVVETRYRAAEIRAVEFRIGRDLARQEPLPSNSHHWACALRCSSPGLMPDC